MGEEILAKKPLAPRTPVSDTIALSFLHVFRYGQVSFMCHVMYSHLMSLTSSFIRMHRAPEAHSRRSIAESSNPGSSEPKCAFTGHGARGIDIGNQKNLHNGRSWIGDIIMRVRRRSDDLPSPMFVGSWTGLYSVADAIRDKFVNAAKRQREESISKISKTGSSFVIMAHGGDEPEDILSWEGMTPRKAMAAGAIAGCTEHIITFPIDTVKTRMQAAEFAAQPSYRNAVHGLVHIVRHEGVRSLYRGLPITAFGAAPSHAAHFAAYEAVKRKFGIERGSHSPLVSALCGISATLAHDAISTPLDVVKQRLQVFRSQFGGIWNCITTTFKREGPIAFYASYPTTVLVNIPYQAVHFMTYEGLQTLVHDTEWDDMPIADISIGGIAGAVGGLASNPLDVVRTRVQTQVVPADSGMRRLTATDIAMKIVREEGVSGFMKGSSARVLLFAPSAGICWGIYEALKRAILPNYRKHHSEPSTPGK